MFAEIVCVLLCILLLLYIDSKRPIGYPPGLQKSDIRVLAINSNDHIYLLGPKWLPVVGNLWYFKKALKSCGYIHLVWQELHETYGNVVGLRLGRDLVVTAFGPEAVREVLTREELNGRPDGYFFRMRTFGKRLGNVL